jgi:hypothetical protein
MKENTTSYASVFDNVDLEGDIIRKGAFKFTMFDTKPKNSATPFMVLVALCVAYACIWAFKAL